MLKFADPPFPHRVDATDDVDFKTRETTESVTMLLKAAQPAPR
jgi:hypothetical protein